MSKSASIAMPVHAAEVSTSRSQPAWSEAAAFEMVIACTSVARASTTIPTKSPEASPVPERRLIMSPVQMPLPELSPESTHPSVEEAPAESTTKACAATAVAPRAMFMTSPVAACAPTLMSMSSLVKIPEEVMSMAFPVVAAEAIFTASPATLVPMFKSIAFPL